MSLLLFSIHNAFRKKAVAFLAVMGVAFGCALMTFLFSVAAGMERRVEYTFSEMSGRVMVSGRYAVFGGVLQGVGSSKIPASYMDNIRNVPHVKSVSGQVSALLRPTGVNLVMPLFGYGQDEAGPPGGHPLRKIVAGSAPQSNNEVVIGKSLQEYLAFMGVPYHVGGVHRFNVPEKKPPMVLELKVVGVYQTGNEVLDGGFSGSEKLAREIGNVPPGQVSVINVQVDSLDSVEYVAREVERELADKKPEVQVVVPREMLIPLKNLLRILDNFLLLISLVAVAAGGLSIMVVMLLSVVERRRQFGVLKALGWTPGNVTFMVLVESLSLSALGCVLGVAMGMGGLVLVKRYVGIDVGSFDWRVAVAVCACGVLVGTLGGLYPAWRANRTSPAEILRGA